MIGRWIRGGARSVGNDIALTVVIQGLMAVVAYGSFVTITRLASEATVDLYTLMIAYLAITASILDFGILAVAYPRLSVGDPFDSPSVRTSFDLRIRLALPSLVLLMTVLLVTDRTELLPVGLLGFGVILLSGRFSGLRQVPEAVWRLKGRTWQVIGIALLDALIFLGLVLFVGLRQELTVTTIFLLLLVANIPGFIVVGLPVLRRLRDRARNPARPGHRRIFFFAAIPIAVMSVASQLFARIEVVMIDAMIGLDKVGEYGVAVQSLVGTTFVPITVALGLLPLITQVSRRVRTDIDSRELGSFGVRLLGAIGLVVGLVAALFAPQILSLNGPEYVEVAWILRWYAITNLLEYLVIFFDQSLVAVGKRKEVMIGTLISLVAALALQAGLIGTYAIVGILVGKIGALVLKIAYQCSRFDAGYRTGVLLGLARVLPVAVLLILLFLVTTDMTMIPRIAVMFGAGLASLLVAGLVRPSEIRRLQSMRLGVKA